MVTFNASFSESQQFSASFTDVAAMSADFGEVQIIHDADWYEGAYEVTPSSQIQTLPTMGKTMINDLVINPIPSNYGLVTWNGQYLTVS